MMICTIGNFASVFLCGVGVGAVGTILIGIAVWGRDRKKAKKG